MFTCPRCGMISYHPRDAEYGYCGNCHDFTESRAVVVRLTVDLTQEAAQKLADLAERLGTNRTTALNKAILVTDFLATEEITGAIVQVVDKKKRTLQEVHII